MIPWEQVVLRKLGNTNNFHKRLIFKSLDVKHFITRPLSTMEQLHFPRFLFFLSFLTLSLANNKGTREFRKSFVEEFYPRWATQRAESAVRINIFSLKEKEYTVSILSFSAVCIAQASRDAGVILLKMVFAVLDHFTDLQKNNQTLEIKLVSWIRMVGNL